VCNHPELFERADVIAPYSFCHFAETASLAREGDLLFFPYSTRNPISYQVPQLFYTDGGLLDIPSKRSSSGFLSKWLNTNLSIWTSDWLNQSMRSPGTRILDCCPGYLKYYNRLWFFFLRHLGSSTIRTSQNAKMLYLRNSHICNPERAFFMGTRRSYKVNTVFQGCSFYTNFLFKRY
jgi:hypothetical protein